jgi:hypothetical protein
MIENDQDIFGKIDAMLERRDADFVTDKSTSTDDFPMLTEVIAVGEEPVWKGVNRRSGSHVGGRRLADRRIGQRRLSSSPIPAVPIINDEFERLLSVLEHRLTALLIGQQLPMEELIRRVVREELTGDKGGKS